MSKVVLEIECVMCNQSIIMEVSEEGLKKWQQGELIQDALPELTDDEREMLMSGICPTCWDKIFSDEWEDAAND